MTCKRHPYGYRKGGGIDMFKFECYCPKTETPWWDKYAIVMDEELDLIGISTDLMPALLAEHRERVLREAVGALKWVMPSEHTRPNGVCDCQPAFADHEAMKAYHAAKDEQVKAMAEKIGEMMEEAKKRLGEGSGGASKIRALGFYHMGEYKPVVHCTGVERCPTTLELFLLAFLACLCAGLSGVCFYIAFGK